MNNRELIKVCFIAPKAYTLFNPARAALFGGAEVDLYLLAVELAKDRNFAVSFITADYGQQDVETIAGVCVIKSLDFKENALCGAIKVWRAMRRADADIYMLKTVSAGVPLARMFCRLHKRIFAYRTASAPECDGTYHKSHRLLGKAFDWSLKRADIVFAQNAGDAENLRRRIGVSAVVIPNGHALPPIAESRREFVLWVGRSGVIKRPELFIDLAKKMPGERFVMICQRATGDTNYEALVSRAGQVKNLEFIERVEFAEVDSYFGRAKMLVNTSDAEGFPNTFIQACKAGAAILSLAVNPDGFLDTYKCGQSCGGDFEKLVEVVRATLADGRYVEMGKNGREYAKNNHDITKIVEYYKRAFCELKQGKG